MKRIVVIGGGASGALVAANLLRRAQAEGSLWVPPPMQAGQAGQASGSLGEPPPCPPPGGEGSWRGSLGEPPPCPPPGGEGSRSGRSQLGDVCVTLVEAGREVARGVAYGTSDPCHLLNVRANNMSAFPDAPCQFSEWLQAKGISSLADAPCSFARRRDFGKYLQETLENARQSSSATFQVMRGVATSLRPAAAADGSENPAAGVWVGLADGTVIEADVAVVATGNLPPSIPSSLAAAQSSERFLANAWRCEDLSKIGPNDSVFLLGTGLTMVDTVLSLAAMGHKGKIVARSRRGFLPKSHCRCSPMPITSEELAAGKPRRIVLEMVRESGEHWRSVIDGLRPHTARIWASMNWSERGRFLRHLRPYWEAARHRMPEEAANTLEAMRSRGRLDVGAARICKVVADDAGFTIGFKGSDTPLRVQWIVNCTGPMMDLREAKVPLLESLVASGLGAYDPLGMGLLVDDAGRTEPTGRVWTLGTLCKGCRWETTAIPEIRDQAYRLAGEILG